MRDLNVALVLGLPNKIAPLSPCIMVGSTELSMAPISLFLKRSLQPKLLPRVTKAASMFVGAILAAAETLYPVQVLFTSRARNLMRVREILKKMISNPRITRMCTSGQNFQIGVYVATTFPRLYSTF